MVVVVAAVVVVVQATQTVKTQTLRQTDKHK